MRVRRTYAISRPVPERQDNGFAALHDVVVGDRNGDCGARRPGSNVQRARIARYARDSIVVAPRRRAGEGIRQRHVRNQRGVEIHRYVRCSGCFARARRRGSEGSLRRVVVVHDCRFGAARTAERGRGRCACRDAQDDMEGFVAFDRRVVKDWDREGF